MKPGREIARFEQRVGPQGSALQRVYLVSLRDCGQTLYRSYSPSAEKIRAAWRRVRPWSSKFPNIEAARADYLKRGYMELPVKGSRV